MKKIISIMLVLVFLLVPVSSAFAYGGDNENVDHVSFRCTTHPEFVRIDAVPLYSPSLTYPQIWTDIRTHKAANTVTAYRTIKTYEYRMTRSHRGSKPKLVRVVVLKKVAYTYCNCRIEIAEMDANNKVIEIVTSNYGR